MKNIARIKSKDVAEALGVSTATVSLAINGHPGVNAQTRQRVLEYITQKEKEHYGIVEKEKPPEGIVVMLFYIKHGIIMERSSGNGVATWLGKVEKETRQAGYRLVRHEYYEQHDDLNMLLSDWKKEKLCGLYIIGAEMTQNDIYPFARLKVPIVIGDNNLYNLGYDSYLIDNREGISRAVDYLVDKGHSSIVYLAENLDIFNFVERREAFVLEMARRECGDVKNRIVHLGNTVDEVYVSMSAYLDRDGRKPTAFILESSVVSMGVMKALKEHQLRIPKDISLLGFDALPPGGLMGVELTLIKGTHTRRHTAAIQHLLRHIDDSETEIMRVYYKTRLQEGNSVFDKTKYIYGESHVFK